MVLFKFDEELCIEEIGRAEGILWYKICFFECVARCVFGERVRSCHQRSKDLVSCWDKRVAVFVSVSCLEQHKKVYRHSINQHQLTTGLTSIMASRGTGNHITRSRKCYHVGSRTQQSFFQPLFWEGGMVQSTATLPAKQNTIHGLRHARLHATRSRSKAAGKKRGCFLDDGCVCALPCPNIALRPISDSYNRPCPFLRKEPVSRHGLQGRSKSVRLRTRLQRRCTADPKRPMHPAAFPRLLPIHKTRCASSPLPYGHLT